MKKIVFKHLSVLFAFGVGVFLVHFLLRRAFVVMQQGPGLLGLHIFLFLLTAAGVLATLILLKKHSTYVGYAFMGVSVLKMLFSVLFLLPVINKHIDGVKIYVLQFIVIYFVYLGFEMIYIVRLLNRN
jgi:hypothetical protein